ncbi:EpsG family protein [Fictibacillus fluitans]|uniref:EpsG family protein n=1 Tax=Fictibacillus fluitans TaxID=3058422 RepID=A0ABT8I112_9BACL|nr:EpsG family protein [Fictibacillus sp. NE201]MDN4526732.1 EpsG family protein [Fictibacillus sp. NE201]
MAILWMNLAVVFAVAFLARYFSIAPAMVASSLSFIRPNKLLVFVAFLSLVLVSGLRSNIGDTYFYKHTYEISDFTWDYILNQKDIGFGILQKLLKMFSNDPQVLIFTTALITNLLIIMVLYKYSRMIELSIFVYITGGLYLVSMNGMRQCLAAAIVFTATKYLLNGDWKKYMLIVLFASLFHESALVLIPIYFIARFKAWSKGTLFLLFLSVLVVAAFDQFSTLLFSAIQDTQYGHYQDFSEGGASTIRVAVNGAPLLVAFFGRERLRELFPKSDYIINMAIIGFVFMIVSSQNWIFARFSIYFTLYQMILISWLVLLFRKKDQKFFYYVLLICYLAYYYFENVISLNIMYESNFL